MPEDATAAASDSEVSQYKTDYQPWRLERTQRTEARAQWEPPRGPLDGTTETSDQFHAHRVEPRKPREAPEWRPPAEKFTGLSVNRADFLPKYQPKEQPVRPKDELERTAAPFTATTGSRDEFKAWEPQPRFRHEYPSYQKPEGGMQTSTSYSAEFASGRPPQVRLPPIRPAAQAQPQQPFKGVSESSERYRGYETADMAVAKQASCRPQLLYRPPSRPLETRSSYSGDFAPGDSGPQERTRPVVHPGELQLPVDAAMESGTTSRRDFTQPQAGARTQPIRHGGELHWPSEPFSGHSTQREDFSPRWQPRREQIRHSGELQVSSDPFVARTLFQDDFVARRGERPRPVRQPGELQVARDAPMVATTTSRDVYTPKRREDPPPMRRGRAPPPQVVARG